MRVGESWLGLAEICSLLVRRRELKEPVLAAEIVGLREEPRRDKSDVGFESDLAPWRFRWREQ